MIRSTINSVLLASALLCLGGCALFDSKSIPTDPPQLAMMNEPPALLDEPADELERAALDPGSFSGIERRYGWENVSHKASASLDHAMWIHRPVDWDGWMLMQTSTPVAHAARPLSYRQFFTRDGVQIASVAQEAIFRLDREKQERLYQGQ